MARVLCWSRAVTVNLTCAAVELLRSALWMVTLIITWQNGRH